MPACLLGTAAVLALGCERRRGRSSQALRCRLSFMAVFGVQSARGGRRQEGHGEGMGRKEEKKKKKKKKERKKKKKKKKKKRKEGELQKMQRGRRIFFF